MRSKKGGNRSNPRETWIPVEVPAIVTREVWEAAQRTLASNRRNGSKRRVKYDYLLRRRLKCARCGIKMLARTVTSGRKRYGYYLCTASQGGLATECDQNKRFRVDHVDAAVWDWLKGLLFDPNILREGLRAQQDKREALSKPLRDKLSIVDDLLARNKRQLERLLELYLNGDFDHDLLLDRKMRIESVLDDLEDERRAITTQIDGQTITDDQIQAIQEFAAEVRRGIDKADKEFVTRLRVVEMLDVTASLDIVDGQKTIDARCILDRAVLSLKTTSTVS
jgi:site-specific DNA recombinase